MPADLWMHHTPKCKQPCTFAALLAISLLTEMQTSPWARLGLCSPPLPNACLPPGSLLPDLLSLPCFQLQPMSFHPQELQWLTALRHHITSLSPREPKSGRSSPPFSLLLAARLREMARSSFLDLRKVLLKKRPHKRRTALQGSN